MSATNIEADVLERVRLPHGVASLGPVSRRIADSVGPIPHNLQGLADVGQFVTPNQAVAEHVVSVLSRRQEQLRREEQQRQEQLRQQQEQQMLQQTSATLHPSRGDSSDSTTDPPDSTSPPPFVAANDLFHSFFTAPLSIYDWGRGQHINVNDGQTLFIVFAASIVVILMFVSRYLR